MLRLSLTFIAILFFPLCQVQAAAFSDVPLSDWAHDHVNMLEDSEITTGCAPVHYCPDDPSIERF